MYVDAYVYVCMRGCECVSVCQLTITVFYRAKEKSKQTDGTPLSLFNMFTERVRDQLHVVLAMSPIGEAFRNRLRQFPSLVNCCTIDWFQVSTVCAFQLACNVLLVCCRAGQMMP